ncbi:MAG: aldehyde dehydrogenase family protein [Actinobacteria bacterium]|nr:aldehyde dehydrogenase family protein [Actinomycetota bacterium]MDA3003136.1 aldehyde dehydrogenase family protein [Actinomycetota bacterium]
MPEIRSINPISGDVQFDPLPETSSSELEETLRHSVLAHAQWSRVSHRERAVALRAIAGALEGKAEALAKVADAETALGFERLVGEVGRTVFQLRMFAEGLESGDLLRVNSDEPVPGPPPVGRPKLSRRSVPLGPVAVFGASNFPFAFGEIGGDTASALAAGCSVVIKEHPGHPTLAAEVIAVAREALEACEVDPNVISGVRGFDAGRQLVTHPDIHAVGFTGSESAGRSLFDLATSRPSPIPFYGELGSMNSVFITQSAVTARGEALAAEAIASINLGRGQFCTKPSLIVVSHDEAFVEALAAASRSVAPGPLLAPSSAQRYMSSIQQLRDDPEVFDIVAPSRDESGLQIGASLLGISSQSFREKPDRYLLECFGPTSLVIQCESDEEFLEIAEVLEGALVGTIQAEPESDSELVRHLLEKLETLVGRIVLNGWPTGVAVSPWQHHGGPYPASTSSLHTSVGLQAIMRFVRPVVLQNADSADWPQIVQAWES